ncbi:hypothetical protein J3R82DRAFT_10036 [Butyriboletus roseoflavus]|nr:hypothetical protein J3R82DRAFT_10036 [Butyriboletus roseoflavus]
MGITQAQQTREDHRVLLPNNPFVPPSGNVCFINNLPPELLSRIFEVGTADNDIKDEGDMAAYLDYVHYYRLDAKDADDSDIPHDVKMTEELADDDREGDEEEADDEEDSSDATGSSDMPASWPPFQVVVSHVCHHWRIIAFSTPSLWTTIVVSPEARPPYHYVSMRLERSKDLPIDIYIECERQEPTKPDATDGGTPFDVDRKFLYSLLIPHIHRWRTIEVSVSEYRHMHAFLSAVSDPSISAAPQLTTLELYHREEMEEFDNFGYPSMSKHFILFGGSAPCLTSVVLWGVHVDWNQPWITSASKLTYLELAFHPEDVRPSWAQFATILRGAPALEKLGIRLSGPSGDPPAWFIEPTPGSPIDLNAPIQLPKVTDFIFAFHSPIRSIGLLRKFYLPALKNLVLDFDNGEYTELVHELVGPATSSSLPSALEQPRSLLKSLVSLKIAGLPCYPGCVETLYGELQNLTSLNISLTYLPPLFLDILATPCMSVGRGDTWLPRLATLYVSGTSGDVLRELVQKRRDMGAPLDSLYVEASCDLDDEDTEWLKENVKTFDFFEGSDDEDDIDFEDLDEEVDEWSDMD